MTMTTTTTTTTRLKASISRCFINRLQHVGGAYQPYRNKISTLLVGIVLILSICVEDVVGVNSLLLQPYRSSRRSMHEVLFQQDYEEGATSSDSFTRPIYGTENGYDSGGPDAVCWVARLNDTAAAADQNSTSSSTAENNDPTDIVLLNDLVTNTDIETTAFQQMPSCLVGTNLTIRPVWKNGSIDNIDPTVWHDRNVTFEVTVEVDISSYAPYVDTSSLGDEIQVWIRVVACSAAKVGFCHPFIDSTEWNSYYPDPTNITAQDFTYTDDQVIETFSTNPNENLTFTSRWISQTLVPVLPMDGSTGSLYRAAINMTMVMLKNALKGEYNVIGHAVIELPDIDGTFVYRLDLGNAVPGDLEIATYPEVTYLTKGAKIFIAVCIGICGLATLSMTAFIIYHRNHKVMTMAQAGLLAGLAACNCVTIIFSFLLMPVRDIFCQLQGLLLISSTIVPAIMVARLWRVYSTLRTAMFIGRNSLMEEDSSNSLHRRLSQVSKASEAWVMQALAFLSCSKLVECLQPKKSPTHRRTTTSLRRAITRRETIGLIISLTLPQAVIQIFAVFYYYAYLWFQFSNDLSKCRLTCYSSGSLWVYYFGFGYMAAMFILAVYVAYVSRHLPSAFNEKDEIFRSAFLNGLLTVCVSVFVAFSDSAAIPPDVSTTILVLVIVSEAMITSYMVIMPKIRRVRSGEPVVMTHILRQVNGCSVTSSEEELKKSGASNTTAPLPASHPGGSEATVDDPELSVLHLHSNDAIPKKVEEHLLSLNEVVDSVTNRCAEGRPMDKEEWDSLLQVAETVASEIKRISFDFGTEVGNGGGDQ